VKACGNAAAAIVRILADTTGWRGARYHGAGGQHMAARRMLRHRWSDIAVESITPAIDRKFITTERVTLANFQLKAGGVVPRHAHEQEQLSYVVSGALKFVMEGQTVVASAGDVVQIPSGLAHEVEVLEDSSVIDVFAPVRQDWIDKTDTYFRR
jgi:quercetin dioxygenase-like cupin family protein